MKTFLFIVMFLLIGVFFIVSNENIHLNKSNETSKLASLYYSWLGSLFDNLKSISGYAIRSDWLPKDKALNDKVKILKNSSISNNGSVGVSSDVSKGISNTSNKSK